MLKTILAIVGGLVLAFAIVFATDALFHSLFSATVARPDPADADAMRNYAMRQPVGALAAILAGWTLAVFAGASVAARLGGRGEWPGWVVTGLFLLATAGNFLMIPHPTWMVVTGIALIVAGGWLGARTFARNAVHAM